MADNDVLVTDAPTQEQIIQVLLNKVEELEK